MNNTSSSIYPTGMITFTGVTGAPNGAWCWYQDERAIVDTEHPHSPMLLMSTVSFSRPGEHEHGDIDLLWYNFATGERGAYGLHDRLEADDHNAAALYLRPDGKYLAIYIRHGPSALVTRPSPAGPGGMAAS